MRLLLTAAGLLLAASAAAQPVDTLVTGAIPVTSFEDARALAVDPAGHLYVADAGRDVVVRLGPTGVPLTVLGGPGLQPGRFDGPADVDPTNGLVLYVADEGGGRIQRFSRDYLFLDAVPVRLPGAAGAGAGRPVAVVSTSVDDLFAADADARVVLKWNRDRNVEHVIGRPSDGAGALLMPVALAADDETLWVADAGRAGVVVYDHFGGYVRTLAEGRLGGVRALALHRGELWAVLPDRLVVFAPSGRLDRVVGVDLPAPLVDVVPAADGLYLLTATALLRAGGTY